MLYYISADTGLQPKANANLALLANMFTIITLFSDDMLMLSSQVSFQWSHKLHEHLVLNVSCVWIHYVDKDIWSTAWY